MILEPIQSVAVFSFYKEVPKKTPLNATGYLLYVGFVFSLAATVALYLRLGPVLKEASEWAAQNVPTLTLANGKVSADLAGPVVLRHPQATQFGVLIDPGRTTAVTPAEMEEQKLAIVLIQTTLYVRGPNRLEAYDLAKAANPEPVVINAEFFRMLGSTAGKVLYPVGLLTMWAVFLIWKPLAALVYSLLALLINAAASGGLEFAALYKICIYAQTPVIVLQMVALFLPRPIPLFRLLAFLIVGVYVWQAIRQIRAEEPGAPA